jgi:lycopene beta-cyclase
MDFAAEAEDIHFFYVLPMSPRHALIETTHFSTQVLDEADYAAEITDYLHQRFEISRWQIRHQEQGVIPMPRQAPDLSRRPHSHIVPMGLHSDTVKPSTGYCYPHAQVQARRQVDALCSNPEAMTVPARSRLNRWFDAVFIGFLERHPQRAGEIFFRLFKNVPTDALTRFLGDNAKPADYVRVMLALPKGTFILQAMRHVWRS